MEEAARLFQREADFTPFSSNRLLDPVRQVTLSEIKTRGKEIIYTIEGSGFLRYMVRTIVGTLLEVGKEKISPSHIDNIFKTKKRSMAGPTAPAKGLCLLKVKY
jgi:tRNA pseudouridine38-40 synthase